MNYDLVSPEICPYCGESQIWVEHDICIDEARELLLAADLPKS